MHIVDSAAVVVTNSTTGYLGYWFHSIRIILFGNGSAKSKLTLSHGPPGNLVVCSGSLWFEVVA